MPDLNHLIVWSTDKQRGAHHVAGLLGVDPPRDFGGYFLLVELGNGVSLDYATLSDGDVTPQHLAFLVSEDEFDDIYGRIQNQGIDHWADPSRQTPGRKPPRRRPRRLLAGS